MQNLSGIIKPETYQKMFKKIFKFDRSIRYASILDKNGRLIYGGMRKGVRSLEPKDEELRLMAHIVSESGTRDTWDIYFGKTIFTIVKRENVTLMVFPFKNRLIFLTAEPDFSFQQIPELREIFNIFLTEAPNRFMIR